MFQFLITLKKKKKKGNLILYLNHAVSESYSTACITVWSLCQVLELSTFWADVTVFSVVPTDQYSHQ